MTSETSPEVPYEVNSQIQPAFVKHTRKYYSINQLMDIILPKYPNIKTLVVLYDKMIQGKYQKVNIKPLTAVVINQDRTQHKLDYAELRDIKYLTIPNFVFKYVPHDEFNNIKLRRLDIEATTSETHDGHPYHKLYLRTPPNQNILEDLQRKRTEVLETSPIKENIDDLF